MSRGMSQETSRVKLKLPLSSLPTETCSGMSSLLESPRAYHTLGQILSNLRSMGFARTQAFPLKSFSSPRRGGSVIAVYEPLSVWGSARFWRFANGCWKSQSGMCACAESTPSLSLFHSFGGQRFTAWPKQDHDSLFSCLSLLD